MFILWTVCALWPAITTHHRFPCHLLLISHAQIRPEHFIWKHTEECKDEKFVANDILPVLIVGIVYLGRVVTVLSTFAL